MTVTTYNKAKMMPACSFFKLLIIRRRRLVCIVWISLFAR